MLRDAELGLTLGGLAAVLAGVVYLNALNNPFVYDDALTIVHNLSLREPSSLQQVARESVFRPVTNLSYALDRMVWGARPVGYHVTSVLLHMVNVLLFFRLVWLAVRDWQARDPARAAGRRPAAVAFAAAALFAVHPMMTEAVGYISGRADVLSATFVLLGLLAAREALAARGAGWAALALALGALGAAAKEVALVFPWVLLAWDRLLAGGTDAERRRRLLRLHAPLVALVAVAALARLVTFAWVETPLRSVSTWPYVQMQFGVAWRYLLLLLAPVSQSIVHPVREVTAALDARAALAALALLLLGGAAFVARRRAPLLALGVAWFLLLLAPSSLVALWEPMVERRVYLASGGVFLAAGLLFDRGLGRLASRSRRGLAVGALAGALLVLATLTVLRNQVWADPVTLWRDAARKAPSAWTAHFGLGSALGEAGNCREAIPAFEAALRLSPQARVLTNLGTCLAAEGRLFDAGRAYAAAVRLEPAYAPAHHNLGLLALRAGDRERAHGHFLRAVTGDPGATSWRKRLITLHEASFDDPAKTLELCRAIARVAWETAGVRECIARNEARLMRGKSSRL